MEESSEAHMETDVSSTTEDLPDRQEVTGSNGTVEMVIVVEKVCEEDMNEKDEKLMDCDDSVLAVPDELSVTATARQEAKTKSPTKHIEPQKAIEQPSIKLKSPDTSPISSPSKKQVPVSENTEQEAVDSSSKPEEAKPQSVDTHSEIKTEEELVESSDTQKSDENSTNKETRPQETSKANKNLSEPEKCNTTENSEDKDEESDLPNNIIQVDIAMEASNDSQIETNSDTSEKEHNKSISRELKSLINSAKESKIISECTQLTSKTRKSRLMMESPNTSLNSSMEADKIQGTRRNSNISQKSNCSEKSDKVTLKRSMRSQNPEFVSKVKQFLNSVTGKNQKDDDITDDEIEDKDSNKNGESPVNTSTPKKRKLEDIVMNKTTKLRSDSYCWRCHWAVEQLAYERSHQPMLCTVCPRSFHFKCLSSVERNKITNEKTWVCPDCLIVLHAESSETRSPAMKKISLGMLCELLGHALERMMDVNGVEPFMSPVDRTAFPDYDKYVVHPMDLSLMKTNIAKGLYGSTEAFMSDAQWILHNSIIFNTCKDTTEKLSQSLFEEHVTKMKKHANGKHCRVLQSKLTGGARALTRSCRAEMGEIEACPECYAAAHARRPTWFTDVCSTPHILLWAKLKGFPYWPAKGMSVSASGLVDVRFFGAHDRAWVPAKDCFLYSEKDPNNFRTKRQDILESMQEAEQHIRNISRKYGKFVYPPFKTQFEPNKLNEQLKVMIPTFEGEVRVPHKQDKTSNGSPAVAGKEKSRSNSKSSKSSCNEGDNSEVEDPLSISQKGANVDSNEPDFSTQKANTVEVDISKTKDNKETENAKKRRRSQLEEAIITILDTVEKRKRVEEDKTDNAPEPSSSKEPNHKEKKSEKAKDSHAEKTDATSKDEESTKNVAKEKSESLVVAPLKISFAASKNGKQTVKVTNAKESPKATTSNDKPPIAPKTSTPKEDKVTSQKMKTKIDKLFIDKSKGEKGKSAKRRNSRSNKSLNGNITPKADKSIAEKKNEKADEPSTSTKEKPREYVAARRKTIDADKTTNDKNNATSTNTRSIKDRLNFDDDTSLAVIARENNKTSVVTSTSSGLPTISSVRSLSTTVASPSNAPTTSSTAAAKTIAVTIESNPNASIFTPTSTDTIRTMKEATTKLQKLRADTDPLVGRVGVRAFARMTSPERSKNNDVQVEIKTEPIDLDDADRHMEKMDLMNAFKLRPVNPPSKLREVRMKEVVITPLNRRTATKAPEIRPRAKKTFPHPKKPEDGQLNGKNSMVYIPIQPPATQPPRLTRPAAAPPAPLTPAHTHTTANIVNTVTSPLVITSLPPAATTTSQGGQSIPTIGQVPTTVHTVPLMTSVNGQWMFSLQPVMSVGGVDAQASPPLLNGVGERGGLVQASAVPPAAPAPLPHPAATLAAIAPASLTPAVQTNRPTTETNPPGEPPRLQQRPQLLSPLDSNAPIAAVPPPSTAGPLTAKLNQNAVKLTDFFRTLLEDSLEKLDEPATQVTTLRLQLEQAKWKHQQQIDELKHNHELTLAEVRAAFEKDKVRALNEARRLANAELEAAVKQTKTKQWCANCSREAQLYCCWNTSYCDYPCQGAHWATHFNSCSQKHTQDLRKSNGDASGQPENRLQPQPEKLPKSTTTPVLTVGGKLASPRPFTPDQQNNGQKTSIIMSMVEDNSGNQTMKCVGTYTAQKPSPPVPVTSTPQVASLILNKQLMSAEESNGNKKVVTSGGYLIVGAGVNAAVSAAASRRMHTIQYYT